MKILVITSNVGRTAPGIVFERLIQGLSVLHQIDVLTADYDPSLDLSKVSNIIISKRTHIHHRIYKLLISIFGINPYDIFWAWKSQILLNKKKFTHYDIVLSLLSFHHYAALIAGEKIASKYKCKYAVHSLDAVPAPIGWPENQGYYKGVKRLMAKYLSKADAFFSTNRQMLDYQLSTFKHTKNLISDVIYNPGIGGMKEYPSPKDGTNSFVYTGGIYGVRKVTYLLHGFEKLLEIHPDSKLIFVGSRLSPASLNGLRPETLNKIEIAPFTRELDPYYACATALIDIDADIENDVFLSSKIINYISVDRIIISETGVNSPSRHLFKGIHSILHCNHDSSQFFEAMKRSIALKDNVSFEERRSVSALFTIENVVKRLDNSLFNLALKYGQ